MEKIMPFQINNGKKSNFLSGTKRFIKFSSLMIYSIFCVLLLTGTVVFTGFVEAPAVPHEIASESAESCRSCHQDENSGAPQPDHADRKNCLKCHDGKKTVAYEKNNYTAREIKL